MAAHAPLSSDAWLDALLDRHMRPFTSSEFLKAVRALSARYVERRAELPSRSPLDSAGKRAAFAGFFTPLHYLTAHAVIGALGAAGPPVDNIVDLGCGTGATGAAWATAAGAPRSITGIDQSSWALDEARWNWDTLGFRSTTRRRSLGDQGLFDRPVRGARHAAPGGLSSMILLGWSANELTEAERQRLLPRLLQEQTRGASLLVIEPLARSAVPWWDSWADPIAHAGGRSDEWKFSSTLPPRLAELDGAAGFRREHLSARSLWLPGASTVGPAE